MKGILTQELAQEFDFITIGIEDVIFSYLPQKEANTVQNTVEINELLRRNPGIINLRWVLQMVGAKIATAHTNVQRFIVDIVPELSFILKSAAFTALDHRDQLGEFDKKYHVLFALELYISAEYQLFESGPSNSFSASPSTSKNKKETDEERELRQEARQLLRGGADEADKGRLEKRLESFHECAEPFLTFFRKHKRIVRLDLKVPYNEDLFRTVRQLFVDFGFGRNNDSIRVVLFLQNETQVDAIDTEYYHMRKIRLGDICHDKDESLTNQIRAIRKYIYRTAQVGEHILVLLKGLNTTDSKRNKQRINFIEYRTTYLDYYIRSNSRESPRQRCKMPFRTITSTQGEVCLFPEAMSARLCKRIGNIFGEKLSMTETSESVRGDIDSRASQLSVSPCYQPAASSTTTLLNPSAAAVSRPSPRPPYSGRMENGRH
uniref:Uncharacterized protein n=1 Tax=Meloidogyne incognita TaxID=6306 RepID=A0A914LIK4_MELIC